MRKPGVSIIVSLTSLSLALSGCSHITHRARVNEGLNLSAFVMPAYETYDPPESYWADNDKHYRSLRYSRTDYQMTWGYAWRLKNDRKIMVNFNTASAVSFPRMFIPSIGFYYQETADNLPYARGMGMIILPDPVVYWLFERDIGKGKNGSRFAEFEIGGGFGLYPSFFLHCKLLKQIGPIHSGIIAEYRRFWPYTGTSIGDGEFREYVKSQFFFGIIFIPEIQ